jgi:hypothetical protein
MVLMMVRSCKQLAEQQHLAATPKHGDFSVSPSPLDVRPYRSGLPALQR